ncbi:MAG: TonB-dependent receptor, partial [Bacteroidales bacterium]|nr:TonB-dependent receptor [Bacteroidales bacterium]
MAGFLLGAWVDAFAQGRVSGEVRDDATGEPLVGVAVQMDGGAIWTLSDEKGAFLLSDVPDGAYELAVECLGYVPLKREILLQNGRCLDARSRKPLLKVQFKLRARSLALEEVVVTASLSKDNPNTTRTIGRAALDHLQISALDNVSALLPGGKTINPDLTTNQDFSLRSGGSSAGNVAFATAVEVNGVRMGDNASFGGLAGVDTRSIPVENIESVEVLTGVPSAEYGDLGSGIIR